MVVIALDIGGTKIKGALVGNNFEIIKSLQVPTLAKKGKVYFLETLNLVIKSLFNSKHKIKAIGISMPGSLNEKNQLIDTGHALSFLEGFKIKNYLEKKFEKPIIIENDANCFAIAESNLGHARNYDTVLSIIWGSGVGGALTVNGKLQSFPMEFGHNKIYDKVKHKYVDVEEISGGSFILKEYKKQKGKLKNPNISDIYNSKELIAKKIMNNSIESMALSIANLVNVLKPDIIILGGGVSQLPKSVYTKLKLFVKKYALSAHTRKLLIEKYSVANDAGLLGAAILAENKK